VARAEYEKAISGKGDRISILAKCLERAGFTLSNSDEDVQALNDWFVAVIEPLPDEDLPNGATLSLCQDVSFYLGELMIAKHAELHWEFFVWGKNNISYQSPVIMGFPSEAPRSRGNLGLSRIVYGYACRVLANRRGYAQELEVPPGHPLSGISSEPPPVDRNEFIGILRSVDRRCLPV
jgi:hypothetical protein